MFGIVEKVEEPGTLLDELQCLLGLNLTFQAATIFGTLVAVMLTLMFPGRLHRATL